VLNFRAGIWIRLIFKREISQTAEKIKREDWIFPVLSEGGLQQTAL
jgi:hypothetical protein